MQKESSILNDWQKIQYQRLVYKYYDFEKQNLFMRSVFYRSTKWSWGEMNADR